VGAWRLRATVAVVVRPGVHCMPGCMPCVQSAECRLLAAARASADAEATLRARPGRLPTRRGLCAAMCVVAAQVPAHRWRVPRRATRAAGRAQSFRLVWELRQRAPAPARPSSTGQRQRRRSRCAAVRQRLATHTHTHTLAMPGVCMHACQHGPCICAAYPPPVAKPPRVILPARRLSKRVCVSWHLEAALL